MRTLKTILKISTWTVGILTLLILLFCTYVWYITGFKAPDIATSETTSLQRDTLSENVYSIGNNWLRKNNYGLYEMYIEGNPYDRGIIAGKLSKELIDYQEAAFVAQIQEMIPSDGYLKFLKYVTGFMNRGLPDYVSDEYKQEIYGISQSCSDQYDWVGDKYSRQLSFHAAHDIGHALQNMMLVGCTSFAAWGSKTEDSNMIIGRNFDFWVGDKFAENKIVVFVSPESGYNFAFVSWAAFIGVCSGMNEQGLTVTINAAKSSIPFKAATPVSLVAREILQYASNIDEAITIAKSRKMFVSESFMIGSKADGKTVVIEKTPNALDVYYPSGNAITCANHFQSELLKNTSLNLEQKNENASPYRQARLQELLRENTPLNTEKSAAILRDYKGLNNENIGIGNELAMNQMIAHHSVIFMPDSLTFWVSTSPWQLGAYVCYDLRKIFNQNINPKEEKSVVAKNIAADTTFLNAADYQNYLMFRVEKNKWLQDKKHKLNTQDLIKNNPEYYDAYRIAGDYELYHNNPKIALQYYKTALTKAIASEPERTAIIKKVKKLERKN